MLAIKLKRVGKKHQASFRLVVMEKRSKLEGRFVEDLGWWNPHTDTYEVKKERVTYWLGVGVKPTPTVWNLLVTAGAASGAKIPVHKKPKAKKETEAPAKAPGEEPKGAEAAPPQATEAAA